MSAKPDAGVSKGAPLTDSMSRTEAANRVLLEEVKETKLQTSWVAVCLGVLTCPITVPMSLWVLEPKTDALVFNFGVLTEVHRSEGIKCSNCWGREIRTVSTADISVDLPTQKITDSLGNPINISAVVTFRFTNPYGPLLTVQNGQVFVITQASAILKQVVSQYTYDELKTHASVVNKELVDTLQQAVLRAGAEILSMRLNELNYAPEIAQAMLKKQAAQALVEARNLIVRGAVDIALSAVDELQSKGLGMTDDDKFKLVSSLLVVTTGDKDAQPTIGV